MSTGAGAGHSASLAGVDAVVTGASRGIGAAVARALSSSGARVALVARSREPLERMAAALGGGAFAVPCDVRDTDGVAAAIEHIRATFNGVPRVLVNSAGVFRVGPLRELATEDLEAMLAVNLVAAFRFIRGMLPAMLSGRGGDIVTIGSVADHSAWPGNSGYAASKFGARAVHEVLRAETKGSGVRATLVSPAATDTALWDELDPDSRPDMPNRSDMLTPTDVAEAVLFAVTRPPSVNVEEIRIARA